MGGGGLFIVDAWEVGRCKYCSNVLKFPYYAFNITHSGHTLDITRV